MSAKRGNYKNTRKLLRIFNTTLNKSLSKNFKLVIEYDGTNYHGWQRQPGYITIQELIEDAIKKMTRQKITLFGSGRTDAGVHAKKQTANFHCQTRLNSKIFYIALNSMLPDDIAILSCDEVDRSFHARFSAKNKEYHYYILNQIQKPALFRHYYWHIKKKLDHEKMSEAANFLMGEQDFKSFEGKALKDGHNTVRNIFKAKIIKEHGNFLVFQIKADGFLRYMVRNIVGTLVEVGIGIRQPSDFKEILDAKNRKMAGKTAPPMGLFLMEVNYFIGSKLINL